MQTPHPSILVPLTTRFGGHSIRRHYRGRGAFESIGAGLHMAVGDIAFKSNFATLDPVSRVVLRRRADRRFEDVGPLLCAALDGAVPGIGYRDQGPDLSCMAMQRCGGQWWG